MNRVPDAELVLVPGGTLITTTPEEGRALAITMARHMIHNIQPDLDVLKAGRPNYARTRTASSPPAKSWPLSSRPLRQLTTIGASRVHYTKRKKCRARHFVHLV